MSQTFSLVCHKKKGMVWIGQGWGEMTSIYSENPATMIGLKKFLNDCRGETIVFLCDDEWSDDMDKICDYKEYNELEEKRALYDTEEFGNKDSAWLVRNAVCKCCGYPVVVTQPDWENHPHDDYWWYCSNKKCKHHEIGEHTGDQESPEWVLRKSRPSISP